jgi:ribonuclease D
MNTNSTQQSSNSEFATGKLIFVHTAKALAQLSAHLHKQRVVALDTESNSLYAYYPRICLVQLSAPTHPDATDPLDVVDFLVDPLRLSNEEMVALGALFAELDIEIVMHAAENDILQLQREFQFRFSRIFDTQIAARFLGRKQIGLAALLEQEFGVISDKREQRTNWGKRPLTPQQITYAQTDTHYLLALRQQFSEGLQRQQRWEDVQDAFRRLNRLDAAQRPSNGRTMWDMRGAYNVDSSQRGLLQALWEWREHEAQRLNRPPFKVMNDETLLQLVEQQPRTAKALQTLKGMSNRVLHNYTANLLQVIGEGQLRPAPPLPAATLSPEQMASASVRRRFDRLRQWRSTVAQARQLEPDLIFPNQTLLEIAQANPQDLETLRTIGEISDWKAQLYGAGLLAALKQE